MRSAQEIAAEIADAIEQFETHHGAATTALGNHSVDDSNLITIRQSLQKHLSSFLGDMQFVKESGEAYDRKDIEQRIIGILANKTKEETDTFLQQLHNDVNTARTLNNHIGQ